MNPPARGPALLLLLCFAAFLTGYFLRACFSQVWRFLVLVVFLAAGLERFLEQLAFVSFVLLLPLQPWTAMFVVCLMTVPFCAVISVGICSVVPHRL